MTAATSAAPAQTSRGPAVVPLQRPVGHGRRQPLAPAKRLGPPLILALATAALCWKLLFTGLVVIGYDTMTYMYPYRFAAAAALRAGRLPLWNPEIYYGVPFLANLQSAVFYPLHMLFLLVRPTVALNWSVALHLFLAAFFAYLAGRQLLALGRLSATVAGALYGFGGFVGAQVGHLNQLNAAAWLPAALVAFHRALAGGSIRWAALTGAVLGIQLLAGHAQESYMTMVLLALYAAFWAIWQAAAARLPSHPVPDGSGGLPVPDGAATQRSVWLRRSAWGRVSAASLLTLARLALRSVATFGGAGALAAGLAALQLLPSQELTALSIRAQGMSLGEAVSFSLPPRELFIGLLPTFGLAAPSSNEYLGWIGFGGLILALVGVLFRARRAATLFFLLVAMGSFLLALGNHAPLYAYVFHLPGMNLFRVPARWLLLTCFSLAMLAGSGVDFLHRLGQTGWGALPPAIDERDAARLDGHETGAGPWRRLAAASRLLFGLLVALTGAAVLWPLQRAGAADSFGLLPGIWLALGGAVILLVYVALAIPGRWPALLLALWVFVELFAASRSLEYNNPNPESVYTEPRPVITALQRDPQPERLLTVARTGYQPSDAARLVAPYEALLGSNGVLATLINTKYKETLNPNLSMVFGLPTVDGYDGGILPLRRYVDYKRLVVPADQNQPDGLLRNQLHGVPPLPVLRTLGVKYVIDDTMDDLTQDSVYYDLAGTVTLAPGEVRRFDHIALPSPDAVPVPAGPVAALGIITSLDGAAGVPDGMPVAIVTLEEGGGPVWRGQLLAGSDTAEGLYTPAVRHRQPAPLGPQGAGRNASATYLTRLPVDGAPHTVAVSIQNVLPAGSGRVQVHALTLIGSGGQTWSVTLAGDGGVRLVHRSDVKLYRTEPPLPRAYLVSRTQVVEDDAAALAMLGEPQHDPAQGVVLERDPGSPAAAVSPSTSWRALARRARDDLKAWLGILVDPRDGLVSDPAALAQLLPPSAAGSSSETAAPGRVTWIESTPERLMLRVETTQPAVLVVRDTYFPGWQAMVDGRPVALWRADLLFRAMPVPAGEHTVTLSYHSRAFVRGALLSGLALAALLLALLLPISRPASGRTGSAGSSSAPVDGAR